jgi:hypothetical protein
MLGQADGAEGAVASPVPVVRALAEASVSRNSASIFCSSFSASARALLALVGDGEAFVDRGDQRRHWPS